MEGGNMKFIRKISVGLLVLAALFSGHARQLLNLAASAVESTALADTNADAGGCESGSGATCN
jgi:hypothetical protein